MSYKPPSLKNKQQEHPKVHFEQYLYNSGEPWDISSDLPVELETELLEDSYLMRRQFRHIARNTRNRYS